MAESRARAFAKLAKDVDASGNIVAEGISSDVTLGGATIYASRASLPTSGNTAGDQAYVTGNNRLYIWNGSGWYNVALLNVAPSIQSVLDSDGGTTPFSLRQDGTPTTITITAVDSDGDPVTYAATSDSDFSGLATLSQADNVFTITPLSGDSATTTSGTITFTATDGVNVASSGIQTFTLNVVSEYWDEALLSIGTSSTNSLDNSTFIDRSTNARTITPSSTPVQTAFHPYLNNWSNYFYTNASYLALTGGAPGSGDFCFEAWINLDNHHDYNVLYDTRSTGPSTTGFALGIAGTGAVYLYTGNAFRILTSTLLDIKVWHHIALVRSNNTISIYIDGVADVNTYTSSASFNDTNTGIAQARTATASGQFQGWISNLRVVIGFPVYTTTFEPPSENLTTITGTELLTCQDNAFIDRSNNAYVLTLVGSPKVSAYNPFGQGSDYAVSENKGSLYSSSVGAGRVSFTAGSSLVAGDFTIEGWFYLDGTGATSSYGTVINNGGTHASALALSYGDQGLYHRIYVGTLQRPSTNFTNGWMISTNKYALVNRWTHIAIVRDVGKIYLYLNGVKQYFAEWTSQSYVHEYITNNSTLDANFLVGGWHGYTSDIKFTDSAAYTADFTLPTSPVSPTDADTYLPMDNAGIFDKTGNSTLTLAGNTSTSTTQTKFADTAMYFDGTGDYVQISQSEIYNFGTTDFTIEMWIKPNVSSGFGGLFSIDAGPYPSVLIYNSGSNNIRIVLSDSNTSFDLTHDIAIPSTEWHHLAFTRNGDIFRSFLNGSIINTTTLSLDIKPQRAQARLGSGDSGATWNGYIENFQIFKGVAKYTANFSLPSQIQGRTYQAES